MPISASTIIDRPRSMRRHEIGRVMGLLDLGIGSARGRHNRAATAAAGPARSIEPASSATRLAPPAVVEQEHAAGRALAGDLDAAPPRCAARSAGRYRPRPCRHCPAKVSSRLARLRPFERRKHARSRCATPLCGTLSALILRPPRGERRGGERQRRVGTTGQHAPRPGAWPPASAVSSSAKSARRAVVDAVRQPDDAQRFRLGKSGCQPASSAGRSGSSACGSTAAIRRRISAARQQARCRRGGRRAPSSRKPPARRWRSASASSRSSASRRSSHSLRRRPPIVENDEQRARSATAPSPPGLNDGPATARMSSAANTRRRSSSHHGVLSGCSSRDDEVAQQPKRRKAHSLRSRRGEPQQPPDDRQGQERGERQRIGKGEGGEAEGHRQPTVSARLVCRPNQAIKRQQDAMGRLDPCGGW